MNHRSLDYPDPVLEPEADAPWWIKCMVSAGIFCAVAICALGVVSLAHKLANLAHEKAEQKARACTSNEMFHLVIGLPAWEPTNSIAMTNMGFTVTNLAIPHWEFRIAPNDNDVEVRRRKSHFL